MSPKSILGLVVGQLFGMSASVFAGNSLAHGVFQSDLTVQSIDSPVGVTEFANVHVGDIYRFTETYDVLSFAMNPDDSATIELAYSYVIDGVTIGGLHTISGLENESDVVEYKDGEDATMHTRPGNPKPGKMTVTKDWSNTAEWYNWRSASGFIDLLGDTGGGFQQAVYDNEAGSSFTGTLSNVVAVPEPSVVGLVGVCLLAGVRFRRV